MHNPLQNLVIKARIFFRRRHKSSLVWASVALVLLFYIIIFQNLILLQNPDGGTESTVINNHDATTSVLSPIGTLFKKIFFFLPKKKTVPFIKTDAAADPEILGDKVDIIKGLPIPVVENVKGPSTTESTDPEFKSIDSTAGNPGIEPKPNKVPDQLDSVKEHSKTEGKQDNGDNNDKNNNDVKVVFDPDADSGSFDDRINIPPPKNDIPSKEDSDDENKNQKGQLQDDDTYTHPDDSLSNSLHPHKSKPTPPPKPHPKIEETNKEKSRMKIGHKFFAGIFDVLHQGKPKIPELRTYLSKDRIYHARYDSLADENLIFSEWYLSQFLQLSEKELDSMATSHKLVMDGLPDVAPKGLYSGDGIVYVGGGKFNWLTLLSIKSLRALGSKLPIEVLIPTSDEYEQELCEKVFPSLQAKCIYLPFSLQDQSEVDKGFEVKSNTKSGEQKTRIKFKLEGYQYKALAILLSSFENVLLLDSDNVPVHKPDYLFKKDPFVSSGLIVWPDFWKRATSPHYYKIAGVEVSKTDLLPRYDETKGVYISTDKKGDSEFLDAIPLHQRVGSIPDPTSESGQLMISKRTHTKALLIALYYNLYGPSHFYPLFSQGSDGEGDKETFLAATVATNKKYYQVAKFLNAFGYFNIRSEFEGTGMGQYDPVEDFEYAKKHHLFDGKSPKDIEGIKAKNPLLKAGPRILFVHANYPKLDPWQLKITRKIFNEKGERFRFYGTGMKLRTGSDFETNQWTHMHELLCDANISINVYEKVDRKELCKELKEHLKFLHSTVKTLE